MVKILAQVSSLEEAIRKFALQNALFHHGKAESKAVLGKILAKHPEARASVKSLILEINGIVDEINLRSEAKQTSDLELLAPELLHKKKHEKHMVLPELPNIDTAKTVVMRFAPGPSGPLHLGHTRAIILNNEYVKRYSGKFIVRFEDTNPQNIAPEAYDMIIDDLAWLGVQYHEQYKQSDRFDIYYELAKKLLEQGHAYICTCPVEQWRNLKNNQQACPDRDLLVSEQLERWTRMLAREYDPGMASLVVKTDLAHSNPAVRDFVGMRMVAQPHPLTGDKYYVYPTYNLSVAIDDHLMGITHILRGKDHFNNTHRQKYIYDYFGWPTPEFLHYGWVSLPDMILKTTTIKEGIRSGKYKDWADIQLGTLQALARRGIDPNAIRNYWLDVGIKEVDIEFSWQTLYAFNKVLVDKRANRYFFAWSPVILVITGASSLEGHAPLHPDDPSRGIRKTKLVATATNVDGAETDMGICVMISREDLETMASGDKLRLKDLGNIELTKIDLEQKSYAKYIGNDLSIIKKGVKIIHWVSSSDNYPITVYLPNGKVIKGYCETSAMDDENKIVQFERFGFVNLGREDVPNRSDDSVRTGLVAWFTHK